MTRFVLAACSAALLGLGAAPSALAAEWGWYLGTGVGYAKADLDSDSIRDEVTRQSPGSTSVGTIDKDEETTHYKLFLGYSFSSFLSIEANAFVLNNISFATAVSPAGGMSGESDYWGLSMDALGILPVGNWRLYGRAGGVFARTKVHLKAQGMSLADSILEEYEPGYKFGAGVGYEFDSGVAFRGEWERYVLDDAMGGNTNIDAFSASFLYRFK
jgi:OOP family OmpA-OmpF porin